MGDMTGKTCIVTGASSGIGKVTARELTRMGADVVLVCRDRGRGEAARQEIAAAAGREPDLLLADLSCQAAIRGLAAEIRGRYRRLDVLVNNAGLIVGERQLSPDGIELTFATNHLGYFLLTTLLVDLLRASAPARVVNVASEAHRFGPGLDFDDLQGQKGYRSLRAYGRSKLCNILFTAELARRLEGSGVTVNCLHPGAIASNFGQSGTPFFAWLARLGRPFLLTNEQGAATTIYLASSPDVEGKTGGYYRKGRSAKPSRAARDAAAAARLWEVSEQLVAR